MVDQANGLTVAERGPVTESIQGYFESPVLLGLSAMGNGAWIAAMIAAAIAFRNAGARRSVVALVGLSSLFVLHDAGPVGAIGLTLFAAAAVLVQRDPGLGARRPRSDDSVRPHSSWRWRAASRPTQPELTVGMTLVLRPERGPPTPRCTLPRPRQSGSRVLWMPTLLGWHDAHGAL